MPGNKTWRIGIAAAAGVFVIAAVLFTLYFRGYFYTQIPLELRFAGLTEEMKTDLESKKEKLRSSGQTIVPDRKTILNKTVELLSPKEESCPYVTSWYLVSGGVNSQPAEQSAYYFFEDQIRLASAYIELGNKEKTRILLNQIYQDYLEDGSLKSYLTAQDLEIQNKPMISDTYDVLIDRYGEFGRSVYYIDAWLHYYHKWGNGSDWKFIEKLAEELVPVSDSIKEDMEIEAIIKEYVEVFPADHTPKSFEGQAAEDVLLTTVGMNLNGLLPDTLSALTVFDPGYEEMSAKFTQILLEGIISREVPLYAAGYQSETGEYFYSREKDTLVDTRTSLISMLALSKQEVLSPESILWMKKQLNTSSGFSEKYDIISGLPAGSNEAVESYGVAMQIARYLEDESLYMLNFDKMNLHLATKTNSDARGMLYRTVGDGRILLRAADNLEAVIGLGE